MRKAAPLLWFATGTVLLILASIGWYAFDSYQRGMLPDWAEAIVMPSNAFDGVYLIDPAMLDQEPLQDKIVQAQTEGRVPAAIVIKRYRMTFFNDMPHIPVSPRSAEICLDGTTMRMYVSRRISGYCKSEDFGETPVFTFDATGEDTLKCVDCNANAIPLHWVRISDAP